MIITTGGIKGGSGKTTIATNLTIMLANKGYDVLLVDADDQETATDFTAWREESTAGKIGYTSVKITGDAVRTQVLKLSQKYDHVIIDTGGRDTSSQRAALSVSDVYLVPFTPRSFDLWTLRKVEILVSEIKLVSPKLKALIFLNRADSRGADNDDSADLLNQSECLSYLDCPVGNRKVFSNAAASGLSVAEVKPVDEKAIKELTILFDNVMSMNG